MRYLSQTVSQDKSSDNFVSAIDTWHQYNGYKLVGQLLSFKMDSVGQVQIKDEAVCMSQS